MSIEKAFPALRDGKIIEDVDGWQYKYNKKNNEISQRPSSKDDWGIGDSTLTGRELFGNWKIVEESKKNTIKFYVNVYNDADGIRLSTKLKQKPTDKTYGGKDRIACLEFEREFEEGEGL